MGRDFGCFEFEKGDGGSTVFGGQHGFWAGKTRVGEKHRTEVTEGDGGSRVQRFLVDSMASGRETPASGKASHRGHRGGSEVRRCNAFWGTAWLLGGNDPVWGKHRTEVTEVTEGDLRFDGATLFGGQISFWAGKTHVGQSIAQRSQRGIGVGGRNAFWWTDWLLGGKDPHQGEPHGIIVRRS
jgi:hypothetical protein